MSDVCTYEFVNRARNEFCWSGDHIVPHTGSRRLDDCFIPGDCHKKSHCEVTNISRTTGDRPADTYVDQGRELSESSTPSKRRNTMLEKDSLSQKAKIALTSASNSDPMKEVSIVASDNTMPSAHGMKCTDGDPNNSELCGNDTILGGKTNIVDNISSSYQLGETNHVKSDLDFLGNAENKDSNDFLYYGWPEIGNFEDIDGMFRSCNSTFDLGFSKDDGLGWLSSADDLGRPGVGLKMDAKFPCPGPDDVKDISENHELSNGYSINDSVMTSAPVRYKDSSLTSENSNSCVFFAGGPATADTTDAFIPLEQGLGFSDQQSISTNKHSRTGSAAMINQQYRSEGKSKEQYSGNGSFSHISDLPNEVTELPSGLGSQQIFPSVHMQSKQHDLCPDSYDYLQSSISYVNSDNRHYHLSDPAAVNLKSSTVKSETTGITSVSPSGSSNATSQLQYMESSDQPPSEMTALAVCEQREKPHSCEDKYENHKNSEGVQESSTTSASLDDISLEAASFRQFQLVMEPLDLRMKLCIRDSLYRLARSAEQRYNHPNLNAGCENGRDTASVAEGTNRSISFMDMETDTNPIDRSIAHLLFYRPSHPPPAPAHDSFPFKSPNEVCGPVTNPPVLADNSVSEETVSEAVKVSSC